MQKGFLKNIVGFSVGTLFSRLTGLIREVVFAFLFGAGMYADAFNLAFRIPNLLRDFFAESALSGAFLPVLARRKKEEQNIFASNLLNVLFILTLFLTIIGVFFAPYFIKFFALGFIKVPGKIELTIYLTRIMFPFIIFISASSWAMAYLNNKKIFFIPSFSSAVFNIVSIGFAIVLFNIVNPPIVGMAIGVLAGVFSQFLLNFLWSVKKGFIYVFHITLKDKGLYEVLKLWIPMVLGLGLIEINAAVDTFLAALLKQGSISYLSYGYRVMHLPVALFGTAIGSVSLAEFSKIASRQNIEELKKAVARSLRSVSLFLIPAAVFFMFFAPQIVSVLFERGRFTHIDVKATASVLRLYLIGIWAASSQRTLSAAFYSLKKAKLPMIAAAVGVIVNIGLNVSLMWVWGFKAFPFATSMTSFSVFTILSIILLKKIGNYYIKPTLIFSLKILVITGISLIPGIGVLYGLRYLVMESFFVKLLELIVSGILFTCIYVLLLKVVMRINIREYLKK